MAGNYAGCILLQDCSRFTMRRVTARNYNGDGISWQICHEVLVENCHSHDNTGLGPHPGSASQQPVMAEKNVISGSRRYGIPMGHRDTNNLIRNNEVRGSAKGGILFRKEHRVHYQAHRNPVNANRHCRRRQGRWRGD